MAMSAQTLPLVTKEILAQCPRFRILVVGKAKGGKSSLIKHLFGLDDSSVSHQEHGVNDITITSPQNPLFVIHDSASFQLGRVSGFEEVKGFIQSRSGNGVAFQDQVHAIWLCIQVPFAGGRVFETGDEKLLKLAAAMQVPVVVVFTQFDLLINRMEQDLTNEEIDLPESVIDALCLERADAQFQEVCVGPLKRIEPTLAHVRSFGLATAVISNKAQAAVKTLVHRTQNLFQRDVEEKLWIVAAMAQRASAQIKISASIEVGMKRYWQGLASSTRFDGLTLEECIVTMHQELTRCWNFNDPDDLLNTREFMAQIKILAQLVTPDDAEAKSWFENLEHNWILVGLESSIDAGPTVVGIGLSFRFVKWISNRYDKTPEVLRFFMGYIVDLTLIMEQLFLVALSFNPPRALTEADINLALEFYTTSDAAQVHRDIRRYANKATFAQILQSNRAEEKVEELIKQYCAQ